MDPTQLHLFQMECKKQLILMRNRGGFHPDMIRNMIHVTSNDGKGDGPKKNQKLDKAFFDEILQDIRDEGCPQGMVGSLESIFKFVESKLKQAQPPVIEGQAGESPKRNLA